MARPRKYHLVVDEYGRAQIAHGLDVARSLGHLVKSFDEPLAAEEWWCWAQYAQHQIRTRSAPIAHKLPRHEPLAAATATRPVVFRTSTGLLIVAHLR